MFKCGSVLCDFKLMLCNCCVELNATYPLFMAQLVPNIDPLYMRVIYKNSSTV